MDKIELLKDFKPALQFKPYNLILTCCYVILFWICFVWIIFVSENSLASILYTALLIAALIIAVIWNSLYYKSVIYHLNRTEMTWRRGVWFRQTGIVPYNRITNVDIVQGPLMRLFKISNLRIQTAGYSAQKTAEISIKGIVEPEPLRGMIMDFVRQKGAVSAATGGSDDESISEVSKKEVLAELKEIKLILKQIAEK